MRPAALLSSTLWLGCAMSLCAPIATYPQASQQAGVQSITVEGRPITRFRIGSGQQRFGDLEFAGGLAMISRTRPFGGLSAIRFTSGQSQFIGVTDTGYRFAGRLARDRNNRPAAIGTMVMAELADANGEPYASKQEADAEGIALDGDGILVSFERNHRIARYLTGSDDKWRLVEENVPPVPMYELRRNRGFEAIATAPAASRLARSLIGISEYSLDGARNIMAFVTHRDGSSFEFSVRRRDDFSVTDADFLPDGDLVLLERRFLPPADVAMRLRRIDHADIVPDATVDGQVLIEADLRFQIDNMEGLAITTDPDGTPRLTLISDDNHSLLQRSLLIEFRLVNWQPAAPEGSGAAGTRTAPASPG